MATKLPPEYPDSNLIHPFEDGMEFQDFVVDLLREELGIVITNYSSQLYQFGNGENKQGIEIKKDGTSVRTDRLSIEIAEKSRAANPHWVESGIYRNDNSWLYIQGNFNQVFIFCKNILRLLHKSGRYEEHEAPKDNPTLRAFYLPIDDAEKYAAKVIVKEKVNLFGGNK